MLFCYYVQFCLFWLACLAAFIFVSRNPNTKDNMIAALFSPPKSSCSKHH